jgi:FkbM family methyltransferase
MKRLVRKLGYDINKFTPGMDSLDRRQRLLQTYGIEIVLDVGANIGQYASQLRRIGYTGEIVSFEPLSSAYQQLKEAAKADTAWKTLNIALGNIEGFARINIAGNSQSSSLLKMLPSHIASAPDSAYIGTEQIEIRTLDSLCDTLAIKGRSVLLKIDTQGFERKVIIGAQGSLSYIATVELEMSLTPLYEDESLFDELYGLLCRMGYRPVGLEPAWADETTGQVLQVNGIFHRY